MVETTKTRELYAVVGDGTKNMEGRTADHIEWFVRGMCCYTAQPGAQTLTVSTAGCVTPSTTTIGRFSNFDKERLVKMSIFTI